MWYNPIIGAILRSPLHGLMSGNTVLLSYIGRKSGKTYSLPVNYAEDGDVLWIISSRDRTWWRNLRSADHTGVPVQLWLRGQERRGLAQALEDPAEVAAGLAVYFSRLPRAAKYLHIPTGPSGQPESTALNQAAQERVTVRIQLQ